MRILMILISDKQHPAGPPVLRFERVLGPYYLFLDAGAEVVLASLQGGDPMVRTATGERMDTTPLMQRFERDQAARDDLSDTLELGQIDPDDFDGAFCVGVSGGIWPPNVESEAGTLVGRLLAAGKPVAALPAQLDLEPLGTGEGLLITGDRDSAPILAAKALLGSLER